MLNPSLDIKKILELYNSSRYLDAYKQIIWLWENPETASNGFSCEELIHLGRLAGRLGGGELQKMFFNKAITIDPENPFVRYYGCDPEKTFSVIDSISEFEKKPDPGFSEPEWQASWYASKACLFAFIRDFDKAHELLNKARVFNSNEPWVASCAAEVLFKQDKWHDALKEADSAFQQTPCMPAVVSVLVKILAKLGDIDELYSRLIPLADSIQSYESLLIIIWYMCVKAERSDKQTQASVAQSAYALSQKLEGLAPLADADLKARFQSCMMDIAMLMGDYSLMEKHGEATDSPFYKKVISNLRDKPDGDCIMLPFRPVFQKHLTCLPSSIASVAGTFNIHINEDDLADELTYNGTALWIVEEWLQDKGFYTKCFILDPILSKKLIRNGIPFVNITEYTSSSHATAVVGFDERAGTIIIHDPSSDRIVHVLEERFNETEAPFGPVAIAFVPEEKKELLGLISDESTEPVIAYNNYRKALELNIPGQGNQDLNNFINTYPESDSARRFRAIVHANEGRLYPAIEMQKKLFKQYPECILIERELLDNLHGTRNKPLIRKILKNIVSRGKLPGISKNKEWAFPPTTYTAQYADFTGDNAEGFEEARSLLLKALETDPWSAEVYHILGDIYLRQSMYSEAALPLRIASLMDEHNEHYAREACNTLRLTGKEAEGLAFLKARIDRIGDQLYGSQTAVSYIESLENYGYPDQAIDMMTHYLNRWSDDVQLSSYAVEFWVRMGKWDLAEDALERVKQSGQNALYQPAAVNYYRQAGQWEKALEICEDWLKDLPKNITARQNWLELFRLRHGRDEALALSERWLKEFRNDETIEDICYGELKSMFKTDEQEALLLKRIKRNPYDIWAWHERGFLILAEAELKSGDSLENHLTAMDEVFGQLETIAPDHPITKALTGDYHGVRKDYKQAVNYHFQAIEDDPGYSYSYSRIWTFSATFTEMYQRNIIRRLENRIFDSVGFLHHARSLVFNIAERFGAKQADEIISRWVSRKSDDPEIIEAKADLLLNYGQGRSDAEVAVKILEDALEKFPNHFDMRLSLAQAYSILLQHDNETNTLREIVRRNPLDSSSRHRLALSLDRSGQTEEACELLKQGISFNPQDDFAWKNLAGLMWDTGKRSEALEVLENGLNTIPRSIQLRQTYSERLHESDNDQKAVEISKQGTEIYPDRAYMWLLYGDALWKSDLHTNINEIEEAFRKSLEFNNTIYEAADNLAMLLVEQNRFSEAREIMTQQIEILDDPYPAHGRMAWIKRSEGHNKESIRELSDILRKWPTYSWAWTQMIHWLSVDKEYELAKEILKKVHPVMSDDPGFMADRLILLKEAGLSMNDISPQWEQLLNDFPRFERIHTLWIDQLIEEELFDDADRLLKKIESFYPESSYLLARRVWLHVEHNQFDEAVACACRIWLQPGSDSSWSDYRAWEVIRESGHVEKSLEALLSIAESGQRLRPQAYCYLVENLGHLETKPRILYDSPPFKWFIKSRTVQRLLNLFSIACDSEWDNGHYRAMILDVFIESGHSNYVSDYYTKNHEECMRNKVLWQTYGRVHLTEKHKDILAVRRHMAEWRDHDGSEMWAVVNYLICLRRFGGIMPIPENLNELYSTSRDLINNRPHDHTIKYVVCIFCETALRKDCDDVFIDYVNHFEPLIKNTDSDLWMRNDYIWAPEIISLFRQLIIETDEDVLIELTHAMMTIRKKYTLYAVGNWVNVEWRKRILPKLSLKMKLKVRMTMLNMTN